MYKAVIDVIPLQDNKLILTFENDEKRIFDVTPYMEIGIFKELKDPAMFKSVHISYDSIEWANKADLDPELLYEKSQEYKD